MAISGETATTLIELRARLSVEGVGQDGGCFGRWSGSVTEDMDEGGPLLTELVARGGCPGGATWHTHRGAALAGGPAPPTGHDLVSLLAGSMTEGKVRTLVVLADEGVYIVTVHPRLPQLCARLSQAARDVLLAVALPSLSALSDSAKNAGKTNGPSNWARSINNFNLRDTPEGNSRMAHEFGMLVLGGARPWMGASFLAWEYVAGLAIPRPTLIDRAAMALRVPQTLPPLP